MTSAAGTHSTEGLERLTLLHLSGWKTAPLSWGCESPLPHPHPTPPPPLLLHESTDVSISFEEGTSGTSFVVLELHLPRLLHAADVGWGSHSTTIPSYHCVFENRQTKLCWFAYFPHPAPISNLSCWGKRLVQGGPRRKRTKARGVISGRAIR